MVDSSLVDNFLKNVSNPSRKYEHRNIMFTELIKEVLVSFPATQDVNLSQISIKKKGKKQQSFLKTFTSSLEKKINLHWAFLFISSFASTPQISSNY